MGQIRQSRHDIKQDETINLVLSPRDVEIGKLLDPQRGFTVLYSHWIAALLGSRSIDGLNKRLLQLVEAGLLERPDKQGRSLSKHLLYRRTKKFDALLIERGDLAAITPRHADGFWGFAHRLQTDVAVASLAIGAGTDLLRWEQLVDLGIVPDTTVESANPFKIEIGDEHVEPDTPPFVIRKNGRQRYLLGLEIDRGTETIEGKAKNTIQGKLLRYVRFYRERRYRNHFGFDHALLPFVTTSHGRVKEIIAHIHRKNEQARRKGEQEPYGKMSWLILTSMPDWINEPTAPPPIGFLFDAAWDCVDGTTLKLGDF